MAFNSAFKVLIGEEDTGEEEVLLYQGRQKTGLTAEE